MQVGFPYSVSTRVVSWVEHNTTNHVLSQGVNKSEPWHLKKSVRHPTIRHKKTHPSENDGGVKTCKNFARVMAHIEKDMAPLRHVWSSSGGVVPRARMDRWSQKILKRDGIFGNDMFTHNVLIQNHRVYISHLKDYYAPFMVPVLIDILHAAPHAPNVEFFLNLGDTPGSREAGADASDDDFGVPMLSVMKFKDHARGISSLDVMSPCYYASVVDKVCARKDTFPAFLKRESRVLGAFGYHCPLRPVRMTDRRGRELPSCPRVYFKHLANANPETMVVNISRVDIEKAALENHHLHASDQPVPLVDHPRYKYLLETDGLGRSCKFEIMLAMGSVVLKPTSVQTTYFEDALVPYHHYVPVWRESEDDVLEAFRWLESNPARAAAIAKAGQDFACEHLTRDARRCYWVEAMMQLATIAPDVPEVNDRPWLKELKREQVVCDGDFSAVDGEASFRCKVLF